MGPFSEPQATYKMRILSLSVCISFPHGCIGIDVVSLEPQFCKSLVVACPCCCRIVMAGKVLLVHFVMKCAMWTVVVSRACLNYVRSITSQFDI